MGEENRGTEGLHRSRNRFTGRNRMLYGECTRRHIVRIMQELCGCHGTWPYRKEAGGPGETHS